MSPNINQYSDQELVLRLEEDSQQALVILYNRYWDKLFVVAANLLDSAEEAEECVQNVFVSLWNRRKGLVLSYSLSTYLSVAVKYQSLSALARSKRRKEALAKGELLDNIDSISPESEFIAKELMLRIESSINKLPQQCQLVFRMQQEQGMSVKSIADNLNLSTNTIKMHLKIANKKLRDDLLILLPFILHLLSNHK